MATTKWYDVSITDSRPGGLGNFFNGYMNVDASDDVIEIYDSSYITINILQEVHNHHVINGLVYNKFFYPPSTISDGGLAFTTIPNLDTTYNAIQWLLWYDTNNGTYNLSYRDGSDVWFDLVDGASQLINLNVSFTPQTTHVSPQPTLLVTNTCFPAGTPIKTDQGEVSIEKIDINKNTIRNKKIIDITKTLIKDKHLICFEKDSLGKNIPSQKTLITQNHKVLYKGKMVKAIEMIDKNTNIHKIKYDGEPVYNVLMEEHNKMVVNNMICETLDPNNFIAKLHMHIRNKEPKEQERIINLFNEYVSENHIFSENKNK